jgi:serine/threonine protein kinase
LNIAHRVSTLSVDLLTKILKLPVLHHFQDAFRDNFVIQWHPESLRTMKISSTRPRVYLIDFEVAIQFPAECPEYERVSTGLPLGGSFTEQEHYARSHAPEFASGKPYSPFKLDIWQLGISFSDFKVRHSFHIFTLLISCLMRRLHIRAPFPESRRSW